MSSSSLAELRQLLKEDKSGKNLYDHLTETLAKILLDKPENAYDMFENISSQVKANPMNPEPVIGKAIPPTPEQLEKLVNWSKSCSVLLKIPDEPPEEASVKFPDLMDEANLLEWAGVSLGRSETYMLYLSVKALAESLPGDVEKLRLFGKIFTRTSPYFILEGISPEEEEGFDERKQEGKNGCNKYAYWVTQSPELGAKAWVKLPNVTSDQVVKARLFRRYLTGNLEAAVPSYPPFPGVEKNLLRAQIAQIVGSTSISPDGYFTLSEDDPPAVVMSEPDALAEAFPKASSELKDPEAWKHHETELNSIGRALPLPELLDENGEPVETEAVEVVPPLETAKPEAWSMRVFPGGAGTAGFSCVVARSILWPGAVAVAAGRRFLNVYVGNGVPYGAKPYSPPLPPALLNEWAPAEETDVLIEQPDVKVDPTPPKPEGGEEEE